MWRTPTRQPCRCSFRSRKFSNNFEKYQTHTTYVITTVCMTSSACFAKAPRSNVSRIWARIVKKAPEWQDLPKYQFAGERQRLTPVADVDTLIQIAWSAPGPHAAAFSQQCADIVAQRVEARCSTPK